MSKVSNIPSAIAQQELMRQRRLSTISSFIIALLVMALLAVLLGIIMMVTEVKEIPTIVTYSAESQDEQVVDRPKQQTKISRKPSAPSSSMARVIASTTASTTAVPVPEFDVPEPSLDFGDGDDFGQGWGDGDFGDGAGITTFFGQTVRAERIAYVIDYSQSMKSKGREKLMRDELTESLEKIQPGIQLGMIFFAGPAWGAGGEAKGKKVTAHNGKEYLWKNTGGGPFGWEPDGRIEKISWITVSPPQRKKLKKIVQETPLVGGTVWNHPLNMALNMEPPPQMIYFMTDGAAQGADVWAKEVGDRAAEMGVTINCVAMMVPQAIRDLKDLSDRTGGQLTIVKENGDREIVDKLKPAPKKKKPGKKPAKK
ncbi:MAG: vWA domain-containing protein [Verrucomicrobiaceae bacterium]